MLINIIGLFLFYLLSNKDLIIIPFFIFMTNNFFIILEINQFTSIFTKNS